VQKFHVYNEHASRIYRTNLVRYVYLIGYTFLGSQALCPLSSPTQVEEKGRLTVVHDKSVSGDYALQRVTCP
jgi:hypothetical protein